ncbi:MAG: CHAT domain-containing protein [Candidatus Hydrogenedentes bacterium]|nr:CHAT domain-containing protein [Candidatus Hydrogenedentota bacterium]
MVKAVFLRWGVVVLAAVMLIPLLTCGGPDSGAGVDLADPARLAVTIRELIAKEQFQSAVELAEQGLKEHPDDGDVLKAASNAYASSGFRQTSNAKLSERALELVEHARDLGIQDSEVYNRLAYLQDALGRRDQAVESYRTLLEVAPNDIYALVHLGFLYKNSGKYEMALSLLTRASRLIVKDSASPVQPYLPLLYLGDAQRLLGDYAESVESMQKARESAPKEMRDELAQYVEFTRTLTAEQSSWPAFWNHYTLAKRHQESKRRDREAAEFERMVELVPNDGKEESVSQLGWAHCCLAVDYLGLKQFERSRDHALKAIEILSQLKLPEMLADSYSYLAEAYDHLQGRELAVLKDLDTDAVRTWEADFREIAKDEQGSLDLYLRLEKYFDSLPPEKTWDRIAGNFIGMAERVYKLHGDAEGRMKYREKALEVAEGIRGRMDNDKFRRSSVNGAFQNACSSLVSLNVEKGDCEKAFHYAELYKGRALLDLLSSDGVSIVSHSVKRREREQRAAGFRIAKLENEASRAAASGAGSNVRDVERDLSVEKTAYQRLSEDVSVSKLELSNVRSADVANWADVQPMIKGFTIVDYVIMPKEFNCALIVSEDGIKGVPLPIKNGRELQPLVEAFRKEIGVKSAATRDLNVEKTGESKTGADKEADAAVNGAGKKLWELLVAPVLPYIKTDHVVISSYDILNYVPFEALQDKDGRYFIQDHSVSYIPSVSVLKLCMAKERRGKSSVLALGNPNLQNPAFRLFNAESEVKTLEGMFPKVEALTFDAATETAFKQKASQYDILHFACHGELNQDDPMLSSLRLAPDADNDGYLHTGEIFEMRLSASLVVLSACNSGVGELTTGNELMGLTRGFFFAGAPSIVASLWTVDDRSTAFLMGEFYKNLGAMTKAEALRQAKLATMKEYPSPFHWAPFCLQGDYR